jgi:hypothetical protein
MVTGLGVALGVGAILIASELHQESTFGRGYGQLFVRGVCSLWGIAMVVFGVIGVVKIARKKKPI